MLGRLAVRIVTMAPGVGLVILGVSGLQAGVEANRGLASVERLAVNPIASAEAYEATADLLAQRSLKDGEIAATRGLLFVQQGDLARRAGDAEGAENFYRAALDPLKTALRNIPLEPRAWTGLAWALAALQVDDGALAALQAAFLSRNLTLSFLVVRTRTAMIYWSQIDDSSRARAIEDVQSIWVKNEWRHVLAELVNQPGSDAALQMAFAGNPAAARWVNRLRAQQANRPHGG